MNYYDARPLADGGGWHYTCRNDGNVWPVGYCTDHPPHPTQEDAYACYTQYLLDHRLRLDGRIEPGTQHTCKVDGCDEWTDRYAEVDLAMWMLCDTHRTRETVAGLFGTAGAAMSSW